MDNLTLILFLAFTFILLALLGWSLYLTVIVLKHVKEKKQLIKDVQAKGVRGLLEENMREVKKVDERLAELNKIAAGLEKLANLSISRVGLVRFNPFHDTGSNQSFSVALLNSHSNGVILSSLHGRQETRVYSKPVVGGKSEYNLTEEEQEAINQAQRSSNKQNS
ncbi:DUF4446 family protein [Patescibacteria group bacterium]|nr:DUF4446 family protein [Patescibacteria group bacterium]